MVFPVSSNKGISLSIISKVSMDARGERSERKNALHLERLTGLESTFRVWSQGGGVLGRASHLSLNDAENEEQDDGRDATGNGIFGQEGGRGGGGDGQGETD